MSSCARTTHNPEVPMRIQEKIGGTDTLLKLYIAIDEDLRDSWGNSSSHQGFMEEIG